jgi:uridine kinase
MINKNEIQDEKVSAPTENSSSRLDSIEILSGFYEEELKYIENYLEIMVFPPGSVILQENESGNDMFFVLDGIGKINRSGFDLGILKAGSHFGELGLIGKPKRAATIMAVTQMTVARLSYESYEEMLSGFPQLSGRLMQELVGSLGNQLVEMTDNVQYLIQQRSLPRHLNVNIVLDGESRSIKTGTLIKEFLPNRIGDTFVVAALLNQKAVSLLTPVTSDAVIEPLTAEHWEGERIYRRSVALLLVEAAAELVPELNIRFGASVGGNQWLTISPMDGIELQKLCEILSNKMFELIENNVTFREEWWTVEEAISYFKEHDKTEAVLLLKTWREPYVQMVSCGNTYVLSFGPLASEAGILDNFSLKPSNTGLVLQATGKSISGDKTVNLSSPYSIVMSEHERWINSLGITGVGKFNQSCIDGDVQQIIRVAEGFHEKQIGKIADIISNRADRVKVIFIASPSASGKTSFIKRLSVQLLVNGFNPVGLSLDDYYLDVEKSIGDETGEYNFENRLEAIDIGLLRNHLGKLMNGETLKTDRYNFLQGKFHPEGGKEISLKPNTILIIEGIHGLNPGLLSSEINEEQVFRIFVKPTTSLPIDNLSGINTSDLRLLRRIIRDRRQKGIRASENIMRWPVVKAGENQNIFPFVENADAIFDSSLIYELSVLKVYGERYLLEVPPKHPAYTTAYRLRQLIDRFVAIYPDHVPPNSILREYIGGSNFEY